MDLTHQQHLRYLKSLQPGFILQSHLRETEAFQAPVQVHLRKINPFLLLLAIMFVHHFADPWNIRALESTGDLQLDHMR